MGGAGAYFEEPLPAGAVVQLYVPLIEGDMVVAPAEVVHSVSGRAGLRFNWAGEDDPQRRLLQAELGA